MHVHMHTPQAISAFLDLSHDIYTMQVRFSAQGIPQGGGCHFIDAGFKWNMFYF